MYRTYAIDYPCWGFHIGMHHCALGYTSSYTSQYIMWINSNLCWISGVVVKKNIIPEFSSSFLFLFPCVIKCLFQFLCRIRSFLVARKPLNLCFREETILESRPSSSFRLQLNLFTRYRLLFFSFFLWYRIIQFVFAFSPLPHSHSSDGTRWWRQMSKRDPTLCVWNRTSLKHPHYRQWIIKADNRRTQTSFKN